MALKCRCFSGECDYYKYFLRERPTQPQALTTCCPLSLVCKLQCMITLPKRCSTRKATKTTKNFRNPIPQRFPTPSPPTKRSAKNCDIFIVKSLSPTSATRARDLQRSSRPVAALFRTSQEHRDDRSVHTAKAQATKEHCKLRASQAFSNQTSCTTSRSVLMPLSANGADLPVSSLALLPLFLFLSVSVCPHPTLSLSLYLSLAPSSLLFSSLHRCICHSLCLLPLS